MSPHRRDLREVLSLPRATSGNELWGGGVAQAGSREEPLAGSRV